MTLSKDRIRSFAEEHIPYRIHFLEMGILACLLLGRGAAKTPGSLEVAGLKWEVIGKQIFLNMAVESALIYSRVLLNFLGVYKRQKERKLESRPPLKGFQHSEIWIERFPSGKLLDTYALCRIPSQNQIEALRRQVASSAQVASRSSSPGFSPSVNISTVRPMPMVSESTQINLVVAMSIECVTVKPFHLSSKKTLSGTHTDWAFIPIHLTSCL